MIMVRAIIRPEKTDDVLASLMDAGFPAMGTDATPLWSVTFTTMN